MLDVIVFEKSEAVPRKCFYMMNATNSMSQFDATSINSTNITDVANITTVANITYCNLTQFAKSYSEIHGYLSILVCVFGSVTNILNICVLTTREMRWPTNFILTGLAVADLLVMLEYIPFATHRYLSQHAKLTPRFFSYGWAVYTIFHATFALTCHFISCCLTVILAIWRYIAISHPQNNKLWDVVSNRVKTKWAILLTYLICPIVCVPVFLSLGIKKHYRKFYPNDTLINLKDEANYSGDYHNETIFTIYPGDSWKNISFALYGVVLKLVPCILLTALSKQLISALLATKRRRRELLYSSGLPLVECNGKKGSIKQRHLEKEQQTDRTTKMLVAVLLLFLITEFPQALLGLFAVADDKIMIQCYLPLGDVMDILALTNSAINFILYCSMSRQFRSAFKEIFRPKLLNRWLPVAQQPPETNGGITQVTQV